MTRPKLARAKLPLSPAAMVAVIHADVWRVRELSELLQESGARVLLLQSPTNAVQLLPSARCDVVLFGDPLARPTGAEICDLLREKMGSARPGFVRLAPADAAASEAFDVTLREPIHDDALLVAVTEAVRARRARVG